MDTLYRSLIGVSLEFRFTRSDAVGVEKSIEVLRKRLEKETSEALSIGGEKCMMFLSELRNYYQTTPQYIAIRGAIKMGRYRPVVFNYMKLPVNERADRLLKLVLSSKKDKHRDFIIDILKYFLLTYPHRLEVFKPYISRSEYIYILS